MSDPTSRRHHRPLLPGKGRFEAMVGDTDPATRSEAADRCAQLLVRGRGGTGDVTGDDAGDDAEVLARVVHLAETEGLDALAELWSASPADTLAGSLWRLYLLRSWVHADPVRAAREFDAGRRHTPVQEAVAGVVDPPGPDEVRDLTDQVLRGVVRGDFADTLFRAAAFARVVATGRAHLGPDASARASSYASDLSAARLLTMADQLDAAGRSEVAGRLS